MKKILLAFVVIATAATMTAQLPDGSIAPDWTGTDINGVTHSLYDDLDAGKSVIMDVSATWCGPCWGYHTGGALESIWEEHGPDGTDDVRVYMFEGDDTTTQADLEGTGSDTQGDWITGTGYPIIDDASINAPYAIGYYPTIYTICPSRVIVESGQISAADHWTYIQDNCAAAEFNVDASILNYQGETVTCSGADIVPVIRIQNLNADESALTAATIETYVDGTLNNSYEWTGDLGLYGLEVVELPAISGITGDATLSFSLIIDGDENEDNNGLDVDVSVAPYSSNTVEVTIYADAYGDEIYWEMRDGSGIPFVTGGNPNVGTENVDTGTFPPPFSTESYANNTTYVIEVQLPFGVDCFEFHITDYYGDGIFGTAGYEVRDSNGDIMLEDTEDFVSEIIKPFGGEGLVSVEENILDAALTVGPNPVSDVLNVRINLDAPGTEISLVNALGQTVVLERLGNIAGASLTEINVNELDAGMYTLMVTSGNSVASRKVTVLK